MGQTRYFRVGFRMTGKKKSSKGFLDRSINEWKTESCQNKTKSSCQNLFKSNQDELLPKFSWTAEIIYKLHGEKWMPDTTECSERTCYELFGYRYVASLGQRNSGFFDWRLFWPLEGFKEAAEKFQDEAGIKSNIALNGMDNRIKIRDALQAGKVTEATSMVHQLYPELLDDERDLFFHLQVSVWKTFCSFGL